MSRRTAKYEPRRRDRLRIHFQSRPADLYCCLSYTLVMAIVLLGLSVGNPIAILLVLLIPGYVLVAALFPSQKEVTWIERILLSIALSTAIIPLLGLAVNFTPWGFRLATVVAV